MFCLQDLSKIDPFFTLFSHDGNISNLAICKKTLENKITTQDKKKAVSDNQSLSVTL